MAEVADTVRREMGKDAIIVSVRQVPLGPVWKVWHSPGVEVIAVAKGSSKDTRPNERKSNRDSPANPPAPVEKTGQPKPAPQPAPPKPVQVDSLPESQPEIALQSDVEPPGLPEEEEMGAPLKKAPQSGSKAVSLRAFQAALRRSNTPQKNADLPESEAEKALSPVDVPLIPPEAFEPAPPPMQSETEDVRPPAPPEYHGLSLDTPKPKLALDELAQALNPAPKPEGKTLFSDLLREKGLVPPLPPAGKDLRKPAPAKDIPGQPSTPPVKPSQTAGVAPLPEQNAPDDSPPAVKPAPPSRTKARMRLTHPLSGPAGSQSSLTFSKTVESLRKHLLEQGVDNDIVEKVTLSCDESLSPQTLSKIGLVQAFLEKQLEGHIRVLSPAQADTQRLICMVGPSGSGKTALTAKLAARAVKERGLETVWVSADTVRTGAIAEARVYADLLGIPLLLVYTPEDMERTIKDCAAYSLILVDTPASNPWREASMVELGEFLQVLPGRATYLTVPATAKDADLRQIQAGYGVFKINGLAITKLDETQSLGSAYNLAWRSQIPLAYFTSGTRLLEDLHRAEAKTFVQAIFGKHIGAG